MTLIPFRTAGKLILAAAGLALCASAPPAIAKDSGGYVGASVGVTAIDICDDLNALGFTNCDDEDTGFKIFGGYKFNPYFAVEGGYADFGEISASFGGSTVTAESDAVFAAAVGILPVGKRFSLFGKAGLFFWDITASGPAGTASDDGTDALLGIGLNYDITEQWAVRAEFESYDSGDDDVTAFSGGVQCNF